MESQSQSPPADSSGAPETPRGDRSSRREKAAADVLRTYVRDLVAASCNPEDLPDAPFDLRLDVQVDPAQGFGLTFAPDSLREQVLEQLDELTARHGTYVPGRVYCYRCHSSLCEHSRPPEPTQVFDAYGATGVPQWKEFAQALLDLRNERVHLLFGRPPAVVAQVMTGKGLKTEQLRSFGRGSKTYALLGQVVAGYFPLPDISTGKVAMTFQFVEARRARGRPSLHVNLICALPGELGVTDLFASGWTEWVQRAYRRTVHSVGAIEQQLVDRIDAGRPGADLRSLMGRIPQVMSQLAASLDRGFRQSERRTPHAELRRKTRPVERAMEDTREAASEDFLMDEKTGRVVVRGDHGRFHIFTPEGKHLTSFKGGPDTVDFRVRTHRWRYLAEDEREAWQKTWTEAAAPG